MDFPRIFALLAYGYLLFGAAGCEDKSRQPAAIAALPGTRYFVTLSDPEGNGDYHYLVNDGNGTVIERSLGAVQIEPGAQPRVSTLAPGRFRIAWGTGDSAAYAIIDTSRRQVIGDSNQANPANQPFAQLK